MHSKALRALHCSWIGPPNGLYSFTFSNTVTSGKQKQAPGLSCGAGRKKNRGCVQMLSGSICGFGARKSGPALTHSLPLARQADTETTDTASGHEDPQRALRPSGFRGRLFIGGCVGHLGEKSKGVRTIAPDERPSLCRRPGEGHVVRQAKTPRGCRMQSRRGLPNAADTHDSGASKHSCLTETSALMSGFGTRFSRAAAGSHGSFVTRKARRVISEGQTRAGAKVDAGGARHASLAGSARKPGTQPRSAPRLGSSRDVGLPVGSPNLCASLLSRQEAATRRCAPPLKQQTPSNERSDEPACSECAMYGPDEGPLIKNQI